MKSVLILSKWRNSISVALAVDVLRLRGLRPVLVSAFPDDRNRGACADHVVVDWDAEDLPTLVARLDQRGTVPIAVINMVEPLIPWQVAIAAHYGLPGGEESRQVLASKVLVRERMRSLGLSTVRFCGDPAEADFFPAIVKPSRASAASWQVRRVDGPDDLLAYQRHLTEHGLAETELIVEEFLPGTEFMVDGPVIAGRFHPISTIEKPEHDDIRHHNAGLQYHPPQQEFVRDGIRALCEKINTLCTDLRLDQFWLHVEGRTAEDGRTELVEINPRPGGGMVPAIVREVSGIDPIEAFVAMALGEFTLHEPIPVRHRSIIGIVDVEAHELGTVEIRTTEDDLRALPGVIDAEVIDGFQISDLEKENFFICFAFTADSMDQLRARAASILAGLDYRIVAPSQTV